MYKTTTPIPSKHTVLAAPLPRVRLVATRAAATGDTARPRWQRDALADLSIWRCDVATGRPELPALLLAVWLPKRTRTWEWEVIDPRGDTSLAEGASDSHALARAAAEAWTRLRFGDVLERG
ncbi:hypothetical protein [Xanthomonas sp. 1678]|uniref:hypothetical protein n=1 Tax=Xanthomonas sp. 1678 TaxID=3158788 RepID=UPI00285A195B|nr:hypothetical protein [Xanthomonas translucens]MEB1531120.1 hypothetical protein [Xanthomonas campestris pv. campestris]